MPLTIQFALNRIASPRQSLPAYLAMCQRLGVASIELRNDLEGVEISDGTPAAQIREQTKSAGISVRSINALYPFDLFTPELERRVIELARYARDCGARALVLCPLNSREDARNVCDRRRDLIHALKNLCPILENYGLEGLIEPLGFSQSALRKKSDALQAIAEANGEAIFRLVHDTFHHFLAEEDQFYPEMTGLVHISGVEASALTRADMRDADRVLVGSQDRLGNLAQLRTLLQAGYTGVVSFEPFAREVMDASDSEARLLNSMNLIRGALALTGDNT